MGVINLLTDRAQPVLNLDDVKSYLKVDGAADDFTLKLLITTAADIFEQWTNRVLLTKSFVSYYDGFLVQLRRGQFQSLTKVEYLLNNAWVLYSPLSDFNVDLSDEYVTLAFTDGVNIPSFDSVPSPVRVTWKAGYGLTPQSIPASIQLGMMQLILFLFENRGDYDPGNLPMGLQTMLNNNKIRSLHG